MDGLRERLDKWIGDVVQRRRAVIEVGERHSLKLEALPTEVIVEKVHDVTFRASRVTDPIERGQDLLRRFGSGLVDEGFRVCVCGSKVDCLQQLNR